MCDIQKKGEDEEVIQLQVEALIAALPLSDEDSSSESRSESQRSDPKSQLKDEPTDTEGSMVDPSSTPTLTGSSAYLQTHTEFGYENFHIRGFHAEHR